MTDRTPRITITTPGERVEFTEGDVVNLRALGSAPVRLGQAGSQDGMVAVILDLEGKVNHRDELVLERWLLTWQQAAELVASLIVTAQHGSQADGADGDTFSRVLSDAITREEQARHARRHPDHPLEP
jgi:hypothetical protein